MRARTTVEWFPPVTVVYSKFGNGAEHWISEPRTGLRFGPFTTNEREEIDANLIAAQIDPFPLWTVDYDLPNPID